MPPETTPDARAHPAPASSATSAHGTFTRRAALSNASWAAGGAFIRNILSGIITFALTRLLTPDDYGLIALTAAGQALVGHLLLSGVHDALIQRSELHTRFLNTAMTTAIVTASIAALPVMLLAPLVDDWFGEPALPALWIAAIAAAYLNAVGIVPRAVLSRNLDYRGLMLTQIGAISSGGTLAIVAAALGAGPWSLIIQTATINGVIASRTWYIAQQRHVTAWRVRWRFHLPSLQALWRFAPSVSIFSLIVYIVQHADDQLIGLRLGAEPLGYYAMAYLIMSWVTADILGGIGSVLFPVLARLQHEPVRLRTVYLESLQLTCAIAFPLLALIMIGAPILIPWLLSDQWQPAVLTTQVLCLAGLREAMSMLNGYLYRVLGVPERQMVLAAASLGVYLIAYWIGVQHGIEGVALFFALASWLYLPAALWMLLTTAQISLRQWLRAILPAALATLGLALAAANMLHIARSVWHWPVVPALVVTGLAAATGYGAALLLQPIPALNRMVQQVWQLGWEAWHIRRNSPQTPQQ